MRLTPDGGGREPQSCGTLQGTGDVSGAEFSAVNEPNDAPPIAAVRPIQAFADPLVA
jgi:hypothetical protein